MASDRAAAARGGSSGSSVYYSVGGCSLPVERSIRSLGIGTRSIDWEYFAAEVWTE